MSERKGTSFGQDVCIVMGTIIGLELIEKLFGRPVVFAVAATAMIAIVLFLYHEGKEA